MTWNSKDVFAEADLETLSSAELVINCIIWQQTKALEKLASAGSQV